jgi:rubrerythrin
VVGVCLGLCKREEVTDSKEIQKLQRYWRDEMEAASVYDSLAQRASSEEVGELLREMRDTERRHAQRWEQRIRQLGGELPPPPWPWKAR